MKKFISAILCLTMLIVICAFTDGDNVEEEYEGIIRFHVIANSNSDEDQTLKLKVRDELLEEINEELVKEAFLKNRKFDETKISEENMEITRSYIEANIKKIEKSAEKIIKKEGYDYEVEANLEVCYIPEKTYGDVVFPAGNYEALNIKIGEGKGKNWWCVLFPPLCIIDPEGESLKEIEYTTKQGTTPSIKIECKMKELIQKNR